MHKHSEYLNRILLSRVYDVAVETPLEEAKTLSRRLGNRILLKREDYQPVFSFKLRGAYNKMARLSAEELRRGVIAASAGNHAQGVALAARKQCTTAQIALAWLLAQGDDIVPIPGTRRIPHLQDNLGALSVRLEAGDLAALDSAIRALPVAGDRYTREGMKGVNA